LCSVHDTVEFEKRGIPATIFLTQIFKNAATHQFRSKGMDGHPLIELPHPVSNLTREQMRALTLKYVDEMVKQLTA
jgi:hypothetical protein